MLLMVHENREIVRYRKLKYRGMKQRKVEGAKMQIVDEAKLGKVQEKQ